MGELSFRYWPVPTQSRSVLKFTYWYRTNRAYEFMYQRLKALSDVTRFNDPVAVMKVATGLVNMYGLFITTEPYSGLFHDEPVDANRTLNKHLKKDNSGVFEYKKQYPFRVNRENYMASHDNVEHAKIMRQPIFAYEGQCFTPWEDESVSRDMYISLPRQDFTHRDMYLHKWMDDDMYFHPQYWNIYRNYIAKGPDNILNWYENIMSDKEIYTVNYVSRYEKDSIPMKYTVNWYKNPITSKQDNVTNWYENIITSKPDNITNWYENPIVSAPDMIVNDMNGEMYHRPFPKVNWYENLLVKAPDIIVNWNEQIYLRTPDIIVNWNEQIYTKAPDNITNWYETLLLKAPDIIVNWNEQIYTKIPGKDPFTVNWYENINTERTIKNDANAFRHIQAVLTAAETSYVSKTMLVRMEGIQSWYKMPLLGIKDGKLSDINDTISVRKDYKDGHINENMRVHKDGHLSMVDYDDEHVFKNYKRLLVTPQAWTDSDRTREPFRIEERIDLPHRISKDMDILKPQVHVFRTKYPMYVIESGDSIYRESYLFDIRDYAVHILRISKRMYRNDKYFFAYKDRVPMYRDNSGKSIMRRHLDMSEMIADEWVNRKYYDMDLFDVGRLMHKDKLDLNNKDTTEHIFRKYANLALFKHHGDFIIPVSRLYRPTFTDMVDEWIHEIKRPAGYIDVGEFASPIKRNAFLDDEHEWMDRLNKNIYIQHTNTWITKQFVKTTLIDSIEWFTKNPKDINMFYATSVWKNPKDIGFFQLEEWITKGYSETFFSSEPLDEMLGTGVFSSTVPKDFAYHRQQEWLDTLPKIGYYDYGDVFIEKELLAGLKEIATVGKEKNRETALYDLSSFTMEAPEGYYVNAFVIADKIFDKNVMVEEWANIERTFKEAHVQCECVDNWAWVFENPDPFHGDPYGIDELLLPENDIRYEDFEDLIFDKENLKPRNPIQKLSEQTWIAKLPIKHPIPQYKDVAVEYTGIKVDQYYGVRTMIMHQIYLKYYEIWQKNLFEFAQMTMQQSTQKMLEYVYSWIMLYYPEDQLKEALRVLRQIRWFSEMAVMNNARYIISYEWDELKSDLNSGECKIPNNLLGNDTMYVDKQLGVIRNNAYHIGADRAYVELYLSIRKDTTIKFSLINTVGSVNIYIDGTLVDTVSVTTLNLTYPITYTSKRKVTVKIEKTKENNLNDQFMIGNIIVPDGAYKDLSIFYDPDLKNGNQPIDEVAKKMVQWANMRSDAAVAYDSIQKNNLGVTVTMNKMLEYWDLHHNAKIKGKRLCIKRV